MSSGARGGAARLSTSAQSRHALIDRALRLSWLSICFGLLLGVVSVGSGIADHSLGVLAAGLSVLADVTGSVVLIWRFRTERSHPTRAAHVEERAALLVASALVIIAIALTFESIHALASGSHPGSGALTVVSAAVSFTVLMPLAYFKRDTAIKLGSHALRGDSTLSAIGASTAILALAGLVLNDTLHWWWCDRVVALVIAAAALVEARTLLTAEHAPD
jgi:divalent metal cation (Fe/Co/Zn/Cd) transporter